MEEAEKMKQDKDGLASVLSKSIRMFKAKETDKRSFQKSISSLFSSSSLTSLPNQLEAKENGLRIWRSNITRLQDSCQRLQPTQPVGRASRRI